VIRDVLLALGIVVAMSTQLRIGQTAFGPGEALLCIWIAISILHQMFQPRLSGNAALNHLVAFWFTLALSLSLGSVVGLTTELFFFKEGIFHDILAYSLMFVLSCAIALELTGAERRRKAVWMVVLFNTVTLGLQLAQARGVFRLPFLPPVDPWYYDRLRGWSEDPNQLGFVAAIITLLSFYLMETASRNLAMLAAAGCGAFAIVIGVLTQSDSFTVCMAVAIAMFIGFKSLTWLSGRQLTLRAAVLSIAVLALPFAALAAVPFIPAMVYRTEVSAHDMYNKDDQGSLRFALWREALAKGTDAFFLGFGPGPHLTQTKAWKYAPPHKSESHNTPIELFTQGGLLAVVALLWLYTATFVLACKAKRASVAALVCGFVIFGMFHYIIRLPILWFGIALALLDATYARTRGNDQLGPQNRNPTAV
jgi:O-Antigen ligase